MKFNFVFIALFLFSIPLIYGQETLPTSPEEHVLDPFGTGKIAQNRIAFDSLFNASFALAYEVPFEMKELSNLSFQGVFRVLDKTGALVEADYFSWGPVTRIRTKAGIILNFPDLLSSFIFSVYHRYFQLEDFYTANSYQFDLSGSIYLDPQLEINWSVGNVFEVDTPGPVHGKLSIGIEYSLYPELNIHLGVEKNYLYRSNNWAAVSGRFLKILKYGISYLSLEREFSSFLGIVINDLEFSVGYSHHPYLGNSYRSSVEIRVK